MDDYKNYLAVNVLNESHVISYRQLSRALKVHTHLAKQMLYDFHQKQNAKKSRSVHATYLLTGTTRFNPSVTANGTQTQDDDDSIMQSSPFPSSYPEPEPPLEFEDEDAEPAEESIPTTTVLLVKEEDLDEAKEEFEEIDSIFLYSLSPGSLQDTAQLKNSNHEIANKFPTEDPLEVYKHYGIIQNPLVQRRTGRKPPLPTAAPLAAPKTAPKATTKEPIPLSTNSRQNSGSSQKATSQGGAESKTKAATLKRDNSDLFKSFAKAKPKAKAASRDASPVEDEAMKGMSEDEGEDEFVMVEDDGKAEAARAARAERQKRLRDMMDDDDEPMDEAPPVEEAVDEGSPLDAEPAAEEESQETATVTGGRRRGRRRVMKKKTMKDEEGYLVTKEEPAWESFSEDEPQPKKVKSFPPPSIAAKGKKATGKPGQGNIMSFFAKK